MKKLGNVIKKMNNKRNKRETLLTPDEFIDSFCKVVESVEPYYPEPMFSRIMDIKLFYDIRNKYPEVLRKINFELLVVDSDMFKPFKYYRYNPETNELEELL